MRYDSKIAGISLIRLSFIAGTFLVKKSTSLNNFRSTKNAKQIRKRALDSLGVRFPISRGAARESVESLCMEYIFEGL